MTCKRPPAKTGGCLESSPDPIPYGEFLKDRPLERVV
jgi:hypothetical protein